MRTHAKYMTREKKPVLPVYATIGTTWPERVGGAADSTKQSDLIPRCTSTRELKQGSCRCATCKSDCRLGKKARTPFVPLRRTPHQAMRTQVGRTSAAGPGSRLTMDPKPPVVARLLGCGVKVSILLGEGFSVNKALVERLVRATAEDTHRLAIQQDT